MNNQFNAADVLGMIDPDMNPEGWRYSLTTMICLLRWKQTADEIKLNETIHKNNEGFNRGNEKLGVALAAYAMKNFDELNTVLSTKGMQKYKEAFSEPPESEGDYFLIPMKLVPAAQQIIHTHRHQIVASLNNSYAQHEAEKYEEKQKGKMKMTEAYSQKSLPSIYEALDVNKEKKNPSIKATMTTLKQWQAQQRKERQQNMKKPSVMQPKTAYKRVNKVDIDSDQ